jgi:osmotically-inducible protein OsmY
MRTIHFSAVGGIILSLFLATGCEEVSRRGTAPDDSPATQRDIDQVNSEARIKKQEIDQTYRDQSLNIGFRQNLIKEKAAQEDAQVDIDRDKVVQPLKITLQSERDKEKADKEAIDQDTAQKLKAPDAQPATVNAERASRIAEVERKAAESTSATTGEIEKANAKAAQQHATIARERESRLLDTATELEADERTARQKKADVDSATLKKLNAIGEASTERMAKDRAAEQKARDVDQKITQTIRDEVANDRTLPANSKNIEVTTAKGVVQVSGTVQSEADRQAIIDKAKKVDGVVRVDSLIAVK